VNVRKSAAKRAFASRTGRVTCRMSLKGDTLVGVRPCAASQVKTAEEAAGGGLTNSAT
jgi:hypothetical protein